MMAVSILLYVYVAHLDIRHVQKNMVQIESIFWILGVSFVALIAFLRRRLVQDSIEILKALPEDPWAVQRFMQGNIVTFCLCEAIALYGFVLQAIDGTLLLAALFYAASFLLMLFFIPRSP